MNFELHKYPEVDMCRDHNVCKRCDSIFKSLSFQSHSFSFFSNKRAVYKRFHRIKPFRYTRRKVLVSASNGSRRGHLKTIEIWTCRVWSVQVPRLKPQMGWRFYLHYQNWREKMDGHMLSCHLLMDTFAKLLSSDHEKIFIVQWLLIQGPSLK